MSDDQKPLSELEQALNELTVSAVTGAAPRVFEPDVLAFLRSRYREGLLQNVNPGEWANLRGGALQSAYSLGVIAAQVAAVHRAFVINTDFAVAAAKLIEQECVLEFLGRVCAGLPPLPLAGRE